MTDLEKEIEKFKSYSQLELNSIIAMSNGTNGIWEYAFASLAIEELERRNLPIPDWGK